MVRLIQLMCANRHTALAMAYLEEEASEAQARHDLASHALEWGLPSCELCESEEWHFEDGLTSFRSLEEAKPVLDEHTRRLVMTRKILSRAMSLN